MTEQTVQSPIEQAKAKVLAKRAEKNGERKSIKGTLDMAHGTISFDPAEALAHMREVGTKGNYGFSVSIDRTGFEGLFIQGTFNGLVR